MGSFPRRWLTYIVNSVDKTKLSFFFASSRSDFRIEYVAFTLLTKGNSKSDKSLKRFRIALKRKMTEKKDNKALRSVLFITKFTKNLG